jgi:hypothetical protein
MLVCAMQNWRNWTVHVYVSTSARDCARVCVYIICIAVLILWTDLLSGIQSRSDQLEVRVDPQ